MWLSTNDDDDEDYKDEVGLLCCCMTQYVDLLVSMNPDPQAPLLGASRGSLRRWTSLCMTECADVSISF